MDLSKLDAVLEGRESNPDQLIEIVRIASVIQSTGFLQRV